MANGAATQGLSTALAPPASTSSGSNSSSTRNSGSGAGRGGVAGRGGGGGRGAGGGGGRGGASSSRENAFQHTISVSLGKAWLEILVKLMRRASTAREGVTMGGFGGLASEADVVTAALADVCTRDALLALFERTAAGVAAAAAVAGGGGGAAAGAVDEEHDTEAMKTPSWADPALVLRSFVLLREVLERVPEAYVVPLRRRGVLHRWAES